MAEIIGMAAGALALLLGALKFIQWFTGRGKSGETGNTTTQNVSGTGNTVAKGDATSASNVGGDVYQNSPVYQISVASSPPSSSDGQDRQIDTNRWEGRLPSLANHFVGRQGDLERVTNAVNESGVVVISGGAGTGKSRLAAEFIYDSGTGGFWTSAGATADQTLAGLAPRLEIDTMGKNDQEIAMQVGRATADLPNGLVWVIDNLPEFAQVNELQASAANPTLLITTRDSRKNLLPPTAGFLRLSMLESEAAVEILRSKGAEDADEAGFNEIADVVGYLPLALEMLAVRLGEPLANTRSVLAELNEAPIPLLVKAFQDAAGQDLGKEAGVYSAITGTLKNLDSETRNAISPFGYVADAPVPLPLALALTGLDSDELAKLLTKCANQSILSVSQDRLVVHALTAGAIASTNQNGCIASALGAAMYRMDEINSDDPIALRAEIVHHQEILDVASHGGVLKDDHVLGLSNNLAIGFITLGQTTQAAELIEGILPLTEQVLGTDHPNTLGARNNLANCYRLLGRTEEAIELGEDTLEATLRVLGGEHSNTLAVRSNLANGYRDLGRTEEAVSLDEETLKARMEILGPEHQETLLSRSNLAVGYAELGRIEECVEMDEGILEVRVKVLGPEHPDTLNSRDHLAVGYVRLGRIDEALQLGEETLEGSIRVLGIEHPVTLGRDINLAGFYRELGRTQDAVDLGESALEAMVRVLGPHHPDTHIGQNSLILSYRAAGRDADADTLAADPRFLTEEES